MQRQDYAIEGLQPPISHYTDAVRWGDLVFLSGVAASDKDGKIVGVGDARAQTRKTFDNMQLMLDAVGATFADILKVTIFVADMDDREAINEIRKEYFGESRPTSTIVEVSRFAAEGIKIEIESIVGLPQLA
ncbi:RidA family protein [Mycobacterium sp. CBMA293]|uniref:RidA family protein n=1 Tax=unclassified Mycolicibacterium TaxID=2636767 RepID=UPI0012DCB531|nr:MULTISPECIES: RidA family protein [unclassified Mycolicibacterium]MUL49404.1 RidA family protein [Mycolicibacterium sp. CBMA 360]MUL62580.1 RidA family protein [Mycolicibacterium sp. CBMA 335]MUL69032.1 RidA family protein [Mycolicibacterium sp. CBMA 311]MUL96971.1 RidA family protein [Mycolicibacterium sp. CBMA 230]MUM03991.1 enamine deaminase RidA [Mycolicibacterium sp. CBMA 213]